MGALYCKKCGVELCLHIDCTVTTSELFGQEEIYIKNTTLFCPECGSQDTNVIGYKLLYPSVTIKAPRKQWEVSEYWPFDIEEME